MVEICNIVDGVEKQNPRKGTETPDKVRHSLNNSRNVEKQNPRKGTETLLLCSFFILLFSLR